MLPAYYNETTSFLHPMAAVCFIAYWVCSKVKEILWFQIKFFPVQPDEPYLTRAKAFKEELSITTKLEEKIEAKEQDFLELRKAMKMKVSYWSLE